MLIQAAEIVAASQHAREQRLLRELDGRAGVGRGVCLFVDALDHTSGVSRFVLDLARAAESVHAPLTIFTCARADPAWPANVIPVEPVGSLPAPGYATLRLAVPRIAGLIERCAAIDPAAVHVSTPGPVGLSGLLAARATRAPLVATHHTDLPAYARRLVGSNLAGLAAAKALGWLYARCQRVLVRSSASARDVGALGVAPDRVRVITPGIDLSRFGPGRRDPSVWDGFPGVSRAGLKALCVGRLSAEKDIGALARMWRAAEARLARAGVGAELIVVGDGPGADALRRSVRGSRVRLLGEVRDGRLPAVYASSDLFVFPSRTETLGQVVIEAQASGLPALVSDAGGPAELVRDGVTGLVLDATDADAWALAAAALLTDDNRRRAMGLAAAAHAKRFRFERSFASFWSAHAEVAPLAPVSRAPARAGRGRTRAAATPTPQRGRP
ncbi:MAG: glycosyltransferase family 1 protein [Planctomycetota bacterium]|nr:MAG: glycosyltransferase family 1 protein [Planctomycetota bacterium]